MSNNLTNVSFEVISKFTYSYLCDLTQAPSSKVFGPVVPPAATEEFLGVGPLSDTLDYTWVLMVLLLSSAGPLIEIRMVLKQLTPIVPGVCSSRYIASPASFFPPFARL